MGIKNSSETRVAPVFDHLFLSDETGHLWIPKLLSLPVAGIPVTITECDYTIKQARWGEDEVKLNPPVSLLSWLIRHPRKPKSGRLSANRIKAQKRREWIEGSGNRIAEGLCLLRDNPNGEDWHIFEGQTQPDVFIQTPDVLVVIEGKRTEPKPTTSTKWMDGRHQMLRHIDCAWEIKGKRTVIGFFIVEGKGTAEDVPPDWMDYARATISSEPIASSLPHRGPEEQKSIASCFAGVTTWQRVCKEFGIEWKRLPDTIV
ncbi:hypothetical protein ACFL4N_01435 [Thermodesulfobacteriota bacterium]